MSKYLGDVKQMKRHLALAATGWLCSCLLLLAAGCVSPLPQRPEQLSYPPLEFLVPDVEQLELANGIRLYLREDSELPLVQVTAMVGSGSLEAPRDQTGFDELFAATLRTGGTVATPAAVLEERLDLLAANLGSGMGPYTTSLDLSVRRDDLKEGLTILADLLRRPAFAADKLELAYLLCRTCQVRHWSELFLPYRHSDWR